MNISEEKKRIVQVMKWGDITLAASLVAKVLGR